MRFKIFYFPFLCLSLMLSSSVFADEIVLKNGDKISGRLVLIENQNLYFQTNYAGELLIPAGQVVEIKTEAPVRADLGSGEIVTGQIETTKQKRIRMVTAKDVYYLNPYEVISLTAMTDEEARALGEFERPRVWDHQIEAGAQVRSGNTGAQDFTVGYLSTMTEHHVELNNAIAGAYGRSNGTRSTQQVLGEVRLDWSHTPRFYSFYLLDGEHDVMRNLNLRSREEAGVGYKLIKTARTLLQADVGLGMSEEFFKNAANDFDPLGHLGVLFKQKIGKSTEFGLKSVMLPDFSNIGELLAESEGWLLTPITQSFFLRLSAVDRYDSNPLTGIKQNDVTLRTSLVLVF
jgi:putative salt-induced outer membrane protein YdiY